MQTQASQAKTEAQLEIESNDRYHDHVMQEREWLANLTVGTEVLISSREVYRITKVAKISKILITLEGGKRYRRETGSSFGGNAWYSSKIRPVTDEVRIQAEVVQLLELARIAIGRCCIPKTDDPEVLKNFIKALEPYTHPPV